MAKFPCSSPPSLCDQQPNPLTPYSAETVDGPTFIAAKWAVDPPLLNKPFNVYPCVAFAESQVSQTDADLAAIRAALVCANPCSAIFSNSAQTAKAICADGSESQFTVPAGQYNALDQLSADRFAFTAALQTVTAHPVCIGAIVGETMCLGSFFAAEVFVTGPDSPFIFEIISGSLPPGITMSTAPASATFMGVPSQTGSFTFTLKVSNALGVSTSQSVMINVITITTGSSLPDCFFNTPYSVSLTLINPTIFPAAWSVVSGTLPAGLLLNPDTGVISGTPSGGGGVTNFTVGAMVDGGLCTKDFTINAQFINWDALAWTNVFVQPGGGAGGMATGVFSGKNFAVAGKGNGAPSANVEALGSLTYTGPNVNCKVTVTVASTGGNAAGFFINRNGVQILLIGTVDLTVGVHVFNFTVVGGVGVNIQILGLTDILDPARCFIHEASGVGKWDFSGIFANT